MNKMTAEDRAALRPGDRVWIARWRGGVLDTRNELATVLRLTPKRIALNKGRDWYDITTGCAVFAGCTGRIDLRATQDEVAELELRQRREAEQRQELERQRKAIQDTGAELSALFAEPTTWVGHESGGMWNIIDLTEAQVRVCAAALKLEAKRLKV